MDSQDYPIRHFQQVAELARRLKTLPAQVEEHSYSYSSFGSWVTVVRCKGVRLRVVFDGRESDYSIQRSSTREPPDVWGETLWRQDVKPGVDFPEDDLVAAIAKCAAVS